MISSTLFIAISLLLLAALGVAALFMAGNRNTPPDWNEKHRDED